MVKCKQCGNDFNEQYGVCPKCGWVYEEEKLPEIKLPENTIPEIKGYSKEKPASKKKSKAKQFVIIGIIAAVVIAGIILAISNKGGTSEFDEQISLGEKYLSEENYDDAIIAFQKAIEIDPNNPESYIKLADAYLGKGDAESAKAALEKGYSMTKSEEIKKKLFEVEQLIDRQSGSSTILAAGDNHSVGLKKDGTVVAAGDNSYGQCDVGDWTKISEVYAGCYNTIGLKKDGTVVAVGKDSDGQYDVGEWVGEWTDIISISVSGHHTVGLKKDGTVVAAGSNKYGRCNVSDWTNIKAVAAGGEHTVGLKEDGTVVAVGSNSSGQCEVSEWSDIVAISAGGNHTVGLKKDGTVVATKVRGFGYMRGQSYVEDWTDIVAISAGWYHTVGLKKDGTVVAAGDNIYSQCNTKDWTDIVTLYAGCYHTIGQKTDGTIVAIGKNEYNQCDLSDWTLKMPYKILIQQPGTETEESSIEESSIEESSEEESSEEESSEEESSKEESSKEESSKEESSIEESSDSEISDPSNTTADSDGSVYHLDFSQNSYKDSTEVIGDTHIVNTTKIKQKKAMSFDGDGDYIKCGNGLNLTEQYSFSTYLRCDDVDKTYSAFFAKYEQNQHGPYAYSIKNGYVNIWITTDNNQNHIELESKTKLNNGQWYYITIVKDKLNLKLYINGVKENECEIPGYIKNNDLVTVGRQAYLFSPEDQLQFTGSIAFLSVFDKSLSDSDIKARYNKIK